jgi:hypothetical protein
VDNREGVAKIGTLLPAELRDFAIGKGLAGGTGSFHHAIPTTEPELQR